MARKRLIDPEIFRGESFVSLGHFERNLYLGLWLYADDEGRMKANPMEIRLAIYPADDGQEGRPMVTNQQVVSSLNKLGQIGLVWLYKHGGKPYLQVRGLKDTQPQKYRTPSRYPSPDNSEQTELLAPTVNTNGAGPEAKPIEPIEPINPPTPKGESGNLPGIESPEPPPKPKPSRRPRSEVEVKTPAPAVARLFERYCDAAGRNPKQYVLTEPRAAKLEELLRWAGGEGERVVCAFKKVAESEHHRGKYDTLEDAPYRKYETFTGRWLPTAPAQNAASSRFATLHGLLAARIRMNDRVIFRGGEFAAYTLSSGISLVDTYADGSASDTVHWLPQAVMDELAPVPEGDLAAALDRLVVVKEAAHGHA